MVTFKPIVIPGNRHTDGTYPVKIRVTFKGKVRRLPTTLSCTPSDLTRTLKIKGADVLNRAEALIAQMRSALAEISPFDLECRDVDWLVSEIRRRMSTATFRLDFFEWADEFIKSKKPSTRAVYIRSINALERYIGERSLDINDISKQMLLDFVQTTDGQGKMVNAKGGGCRESTIGKDGCKTSATHISKLAHIFNAAKLKYNDEDTGSIVIPRSPFSSIVLNPPPPKGQTALSRDTIQATINDRTAPSSIRTALDAFLLSMCLMGANMADLWDTKKFTGEVWNYHRAKTAGRRQDGAEMRVRIPVQIVPIIERLRGSGKWWLNALHAYANDKDQCTRKVNRHLAQWCETNGVQPFTFYAARHSFATLCRNDCKVDKATVADCLCHIGEHKITDIYAERAWSLMWEANEKVVSLFDWSAITKE